MGVAGTVDRRRPSVFNGHVPGAGAVVFVESLPYHRAVVQARGDNVDRPHLAAVVFFELGGRQEISRNHFLVSGGIGAVSVGVFVDDEVVRAPRDIGRYCQSEAK